MRKALLSLLIASTLGISTFIPIYHSQAEVNAKVTTCSSLVTKNERILKSGNCISAREATAHWHILKSDTGLAGEDTTKTIKTCSSKPSSAITYTLIRKTCSKNQIEAIYFRLAILPSEPVVSLVESASDSTVLISLAKPVQDNPDAPVMYYVVTTKDGFSQKVLSSSGKLHVSGLKASTTYSFLVTATTVDGTTKTSSASDAVTTRQYIASATRSTVPAAQVTLLSNDSASVTIPAGATSVAVVAANLGNPSLSFGSQSSSVTATISAASNPAGGSSTPFTVSGSTKIVDINVSGLTGSATVCLDASPTARLWHYVGGVWTDITTSHTSTQVCGSTSSFSPFTGEEPLPSPDFTLSTNSRIVNQDSPMAAVTAAKNGHSQTVTYSVTPALPSGLSINSSTGTVSGTPTTTASATDYIITAINAASETATQTLSITVDAALSCAEGGACVLGAVGPGGGTIFYVSVGGFNCGATFSSTGSPTGGLCHYLEMRNADLGSKQICGTSGDNWKTTTSAAIGSGYKNTLAQLASLTIRNECLTTSNALGASRATFGGFSDWYMPSKDEATALVAYAYPSGPPASPPAPYVAGYWTSTQTNSGSAYFVNFTSGFPVMDAWQRNGNSPRPIRAF